MAARRRWPPAPGRVRFGSLAGTEPVSRAFGGDRGTPIDRYYIERFLAENAADIRGHVLEIGDDAYTRRFGEGRVTRSSVLDLPGADNPGATLRADLAEGATIPDAAFDAIVVTQTLHMIYDVRSAVRTLARIVAPGGVVLATIPGITQIDRADGPGKWFWAMTQTAARRLFEDAFGAGAVEARCFGNVLAATAFLQGVALEEMEAAKLDVRDPLYPLVTGVRAVRRA